MLHTWSKKQNCQLKRKKRVKPFVKMTPCILYTYIHILPYFGSCSFSRSVSYCRENYTQSKCQKRLILSIKTYKDFELLFDILESSLLFFFNQSNSSFAVILTLHPATSRHWGLQASLVASMFFVFHANFKAQRSWSANDVATQQHYQQVTLKRETKSCQSSMFV